MKESVTEAEVRESVRIFVARGGIIRVLPPELDWLPWMVGWKYGAYENLFNSIWREQDESSDGDSGA